MSGPIGMGSNCSIGETLGDASEGASSTRSPTEVFLRHQPRDYISAVDALHLCYICGDNELLKSFEHEASKSKRKRTLTGFLFAVRRLGRVASYEQLIKLQRTP